MRTKVFVIAGALIGAGLCGLAHADHIGGNYLSQQVVLKAGQRKVVSLDCGNGFAPGKGGAYVAHKDGSPRLWVQPLINQFPLLDSDHDSMVGLTFSISNPSGAAETVVVWQTCLSDNNGE